MTAGCSMTNDLSAKQNDVDLPLDSVIQDKELSQELQKVCPSTIDLHNHKTKRLSDDYQVSLVLPISLASVVISYCFGIIYTKLLFHVIHGLETFLLQG